MAGYDLKEGTYNCMAVSEDELWAAFANVFSSKSRNDSSYKFGFLKSIIDNMYNVDSELRLTFDRLFSKFAEIYWNLILKYKLRQKAIVKDNRKTHLESILEETAEKYSISDAIPYESLSDEIKIYINHHVKVKCKKYVVGALFEDTNQLFYSFSKNGEWLQINPIMYEFICKHKVIIEKMNYYEWARFLERVNEPTATSLLLNNLEYSSKRNNLTYYRQILFEEFETKNCFYCGKRLVPGKIDVDHFVPWSFIKDDNLWNLVLSCSSCNRVKKDRLPGEFFLGKLLERNEHLKNQCPSDELINYTSERLSSIYHWARKNGYITTWK